MSSSGSSRSFSFLAPIVTLIWPLFIACSVLVAAVWLSGFGEGAVAQGDFNRALPNPELRTALVALSRVLDPIWITLGAVHLYLFLARAEGLDIARRWGGVVFIAGLVISNLIASVGTPLPIIHFPPNLGWKLGMVSFAVPLLWMLIILGARETVLRVFPRLAHHYTAVLTGLACTLTLAIIDPVAWKYRAWWLWYPGRTDAPNHAPWLCFALWFLLTAALAYFMRSPHVVPKLKKRPITPIVAYAILNGIAAAAWLRLR